MNHYKHIQSVCTYCGVGCEIEALIENNKIVKIVPKKDGAVNRNKLCIKGREGFCFIDSKNRIDNARVKKSFFEKNRELFETVDRSLLKEYDEDFFECDYETGAKITALKLKQIKDNFGANSICGVGGARTSCESSFVFQKFIRKVIGSPNIDNCARVCHSPSLNGLRYAFGEGASSNPFDDILEAEFLLVIGSNTTEAHPIVSNRILDGIKKGISLAVVDVREIQLSKKANYHISLPPESNLLFLNMMAYTILHEELYDKNFISTRTMEFEIYKNSILNDPFANPSFFENIQGYEHLTIQIKELARVYAKSRSLIIWGLGITEHLDGSYSVSAIANLALLTGNIGKVGAGVMPLRGQNNVQGTCDMGCLPNYLPDYKKPEIEGLKSIDMFDEMLHGNIKALYNLGEDITHIHANLNKLNKSLENLELLVVNDILDVSISKKADIIFGVQSAYEKVGVYVNAERRLHLSQPLVESSRVDDWEILQLIANFLNSNWTYNSSKDIWEEIRKEVSRYSGATYEMLIANRDGIQWPILDKETKRLYEHKFHTKTSLGKFRYKQYDLRGFVKALYEKSTPKMTLTTGRTIYHYNNASQTKESLKLLEYHHEDIVYISHEDAKSIDINKKYILKSIYGETKPLQFRESKSLKKCVLYTTFHHFQSNINTLFGDEGDFFTKASRFKAVEVEIIESTIGHL